MVPLKIYLPFIFTLIFLLCMVFIMKQMNGDTKINDSGNKSYIAIRLEGPLSPTDPQVIGYIRDKYLVPPSTQPYDLQLNKQGMYADYYNSYRRIAVSWVYADHLLSRIYRNLPAGVFVEAGAMDGEFISNSLPLELDHRWTGLMVEPDQQMYQRLLKKNRKAWVSPACLSTEAYPHKSTLVSYAELSREAGVPEGTFHHGITALLEKGGKAKDMPERSKFGYELYQVVQCFPLHSIILATNLSHVDLISLDVEGSESLILTHFDFGAVEVDAWLVEHQHPNVTMGEGDRIDYDFIHWFHDRGYNILTVLDHPPYDYFFYRRGSSLHKHLQELMRKKDVASQEIAKWNALKSLPTDTEQLNIL